MKTSRRIAIALAATMLLAAVAAALVLWRATQAPIGLGPAQALLMRALASAAPGVATDIGAARWAWRRDDGTLALLLDDVALTAPTWPAPLRIERLRVTVEAGAMMLGRLRLIGVEGAGISAQVDWCLQDCPAGAGKAGDYADIRAAVLAVLDQVLRQAAETRRWRDLRLGGENVIIFHETGSGVRHRLHLPQAQLQRRGMAVRLDATGSLDRAETGAAFTVSGEIDGQGGGAVDLALETARLDGLTAGLALAGWDRAAALPLRIELGWRGGGGNVAEDRLMVALTGGPGQIGHPQHYPEPRRFDALSARAQGAPANGTWRVERLTAEFAGARFAGQAEIRAGQPGPDLQISGRFTDMAVAVLKDYWPVTVGTGGRDWVVENITAGTIPAADLQFAAQPQHWAAGAMPDNALSLDFALTGITAHYRRPMPPIVNADGRGRLDLDGLTLDVASGQVNGLTIKPSTMEIAPFNAPPTYGDIVIALEGAVQPMLEIADSEPLGYIGAYGLKPSDASGEASARMTLRLPLLKDVPIEAVEFAGAFTLRALAMPGLMPHGGISDGELALHVDTEELRAEGVLTLAGVPARMTWREDFAATTEQPTALTLNAAIQPDDLRRFGLAPEPRFAGEARVAIEARGRGTEISRGRLAVDLNDAAVREPLMGWHKPLGQPGSLTGAFRISQGQFYLVDAAAAGAGLDALFNLSLEPKANKLSLDFKQFRLGETSLAGSMIMNGPQWHLLMHGTRLDLRPAIEWLYRPGDRDDQAVPLPNVAASVTIDEVLLADDEILTGLVAGVETGGNRWRDVTFTGQLGESGAVSLRVVSDGDQRQLTLRADDAGRAARALGLFSQGEGGDLEVLADLTGDNAAIAMDGRATMTDFRLREAPTLARILSVGSLTGIANLARDGGIHFKSFDVPFSMHDGVIDIDDASANGPALGLTMTGQFVRSLERANLKGVIVPAYTLNSFIGKIPILGNILAGGDKEGVFAINYQVEGDLTEPQISVNPMSILTPGILRRILQGPRGTVEPEPENEIQSDAAGPAEAQQ
ncbi:MAG: hypothetical protein Tsb0016_02020 [Sphingomonadales bacterium]